MKILPVVILFGAMTVLVAACGSESSRPESEMAREPTPAAESREDPYQRIRAVDPTFMVRSTLKVNPCDGRFMDLVEEQTGLTWDESPTAMDGIVGGQAFTRCGFRDSDISVLMISQGLSFDLMEPNLEPRDDWDLPGAYWWEVGERRGIVRPTDYAGGTCDVGLETSFGHMSFSGRYRYSEPGDACAAVKGVVERLEPHLWD